MKKTLYVLMLIFLVCTIAFVGCDNGVKPTEHVCQHVCPICGKCTDVSCTDEVCKDKCPGHFVITYDVSGGNALDSATQTVDVGGAFVLVTPSRDGYKFIKWVNVENNEEITDGIYNFGKDITLKAIWEEQHVCQHVCPICGKCTDASCTDDVCKDKCPGHFEITYDVNGGNALDSDTQVVDAGSAYTLVTPSRDGYKFIKWVNTENNEEITDGIYSFGKNITLKAVWVRNDDGWSEWVGSSNRG